MQSSSLPWSDLSTHYQKDIKSLHLKDLLSNSQRNQQLVAEFDNIIFDYTHQKVTQQTLSQFEKLIEKTDLKSKLKDLFNGKHINTTEDRAVLHTALRAPLNSQVHSQYEQLKPILKNVHDVRQRIQQFSTKVRQGKHIGATGKSLRNLIVIGIGGSYLSIQFVYQALRSNPACQKQSSQRKIRFLANVDPIDFSRAIQGLNPQQTLLLVNSKTFTTAETMLNAHSCKKWLIDQFKKLGVNDQALIAKNHICACSTNLKETSKFGINQDNVFGFWDFVGGRFSVWSAIGVLPLSIHFGYDTVCQFLNGGHSIDKHLLCESNLKKNIPLLLGLLGFYNTTILSTQSRAIVPYCQPLCKFAPHIQQLDMQSNGKSCNLKNQQINNYDTAIVNFGQPGTNGQHSFFQLLHQGRVVPCEFIAYTQSQQPKDLTQQKIHPISNHNELMSNFFSQPDALAIGKSIEVLKSQNCPQHLLNHKLFKGDRPSLSILFKGTLTPYNCGQLLAMYEHRTSIQGFLWNVNSYDQWGVELGKVLAKKVRTMMEENKVSESINSATQRLLKVYLEDNNAQKVKKE